VVPSTKRKRTKLRRPGKGAKVAAPRVHIDAEQLAAFDAWIATSSDRDRVEKYFAIPNRERAVRLARFVQEQVDRELRALERLKRAHESKLIELDVRVFKSSLELVESSRDLVLAAIEEALETRDRDDVESLVTTLSFVEEADDLLQELDAARANAVAGERALAKAQARWQQGIAAACSRLLAEHLWGRGPDDAIEKIAGVLHKRSSVLSKWLEERGGDLKADGPQITADCAIAEMVVAHPRSVRRWRGDVGGRFFDRVLQVHATEAEAPPSELIAGFIEFLNARGDVSPTDTSPVLGSLSAALARFETPRNKPKGHA
jgi:hypothetical protein